MTNLGAQRLEFVLRQFMQLSTMPNASIAAIAERLRSTLSPTDCAVCDQIEQLLVGNAVLSAPAKGSVDMELRRILEETHSKGGNTLIALSSYYHGRERMRREVTGFFLGLIDQGVYIAALLLTLLIVAIVYVIFVLPQFAALYASVGANLPAFTQLVLNTSIVLWPMFVLMVGTVLSAWFITLRLRKRVLALLPFSARACSLPVIRSIARDHNTMLWLYDTRVFLSAGLSSQDARDAASRRVSNIYLPKLNAEHIECAAKLGTLEMELAAQVTAIEDRQMRSLVRARTLGLYFLRFLIYWWIGGLIIAMYLPIFKLGAII
jgi:type II secretory pathway component PulF